MGSKKPSGAFPTKTGGGKSGSKKLAAFKAVSSSSGTSTPTIKQQTEAERQATMLITSTGERAKGINRTQQALAALQTQGGALSGSTAFSKTSGMLAAVSSGNKLTQAQQNAAVHALVSISPTNTPNATKRELENIRANIVTGIPSSQTLSVFKPMVDKAELKKILEQDLYYRGKRITNTAKVLKEQERSLAGAEMKLAKFDQYIDNNEFTGTQSQYTQYQKAYSDYVKKYNTYSSNVQLYNEDIKTYNKNAQNVESKKSLQPIRAAVKIANAKYTATQTSISKKLPTVKQAEPYIRQFVKSSTPAGLATRTTDKILNRKDTEKLVQFYLGGYESVHTQPLKAAATFATFFVGGVAVKGLSTAAKALGAGAKTAKVAKLIETGAIGVYVAGSGARYMTITDARQAGYVTGDIIFNELLPAGMGLKYGIKVVSSIPKNTNVLKGYGTKTVNKVVKYTPKSVKVELTKTKSLITRYRNSEKIDKVASARFNQKLASLELEYNNNMFGVKEYKAKVSDIKNQVTIKAEGRTIVAEIPSRQKITKPLGRDFYTKQDVTSIRGKTSDPFGIKASQRNANLNAYTYATNAEAKPPSYYIKQEISRISDILNGRNIKLITMEVDAYGNITYKITTSKSLITRKEEALKVIQQMKAVQKLQAQLISLNKQHIAFKNGIKNLLPQDLNYRKMVKNEWGEIEIYEVKSKSIKTKLNEYNAKIREVKTKIRDIEHKLDIKQKALQSSLKSNVTLVSDPLLKPISKQLDLTINKIKLLTPRGRTKAKLDASRKQKGELERQSRKLEQQLKNIADEQRIADKKNKIFEFKKQLKALERKIAEFERFEKAERAEFDKQLTDLSSIVKPTKKETAIKRPTKKLDAERDAKLKSGEYIEVRRSDGQIVLQKVKYKQDVLTVQQQRQVELQKQHIKSVQDISTKQVQKIKVNGKVKEVTKLSQVSAVALLYVAGNKLKPTTTQQIKQLAGVVQKQAIQAKQSQKQLQTQRPSTKQLQQIASIQAQAEKTAQTQKQKQRQRQALTEKAKEEIPIPVIPKIVTTKSKNKPRKTTKKLTATDTSLNINKIGKLLGGFK